MLTFKFNLNLYLLLIKIYFIMKKIIFLFALILVASSGFLFSQQIRIQEQACIQEQDVSIVTEERPDLPPNPSSKDTYELTYCDGSIGSYLGNASATGTSYCSACINFTATQMSPYIGTNLLSMKLFVPSESRLPNFNASFSRIWIKSTLNGAVLYEQTFTPTLDAWNEITLTTPYPITAGSFVMGYTLLCENLAAQEIRALAMSAVATNPYQPGGLNYVRNDNANNYKEGATFTQFTTSGNLTIIGMVDGGNFLANDLEARILRMVTQEFKIKNEVYNYALTVVNTGSNAQNSYTVQLLDGADAVLASTEISETIAPGEQKTFNLAYASPVLGNLTLKGKVVLAGDEFSQNDVTDPIACKIYPMTPMSYGTNTIASGIGSTTYSGQRNAAICYPSYAIAPFAANELIGVEIGINDGTIVDGYISLWIRNSLEGEDLRYAALEPATGWLYWELEEPLLIPENDSIVIGYTFETYPGYAIGTCNNTQTPGVNWMKRGTADWTLIEINGGTPLAGNWAIIGVVSKVMDCLPATDLVVTYDTDCTAATLTWSPSEDNAYNVYRDGARIASNVVAPTYTDLTFDPTKEHTWAVRVICEDDETAAVQATKDKCKGDGLNDIVKNGFTIAPNPANSIIKITAETIFNRIEVINFLGQTVISQPNSNNNTTLDISTLNNGVYFVRIVSENGTSVQKFVKQ